MLNRLPKRNAGSQCDPHKTWLTCVLNVKINRTDPVIVAVRPPKTFYGIERETVGKFIDASVKNHAEAERSPSAAANELVGSRTLAQFSPDRKLSCSRFILP